MSAPEPEVWVVVSSHDGDPSTDDGPIVWETYTRKATREEAVRRAAIHERRYGACRIARLVFEDQPQETSR